MAGLIGDWLKGATLRQVSDRQEMWQQADHFARLVHDNLDLRDTAFTIANEGRQLIGCDRVSVAIKKGGRCKVQAISGQDSIENRSNIVLALNNLATRVVSAGESLWYDGSVEDLPPQLEEAIEDYVDLSHGRTIAVLPIRRPEKVIEGDVHSKETVQSNPLITSGDSSIFFSCAKYSLKSSSVGSALFLSSFPFKNSDGSKFITSSFLSADEDKTKK